MLLLLLSRVYIRGNFKWNRADGRNDASHEILRYAKSPEPVIGSIRWTVNRRTESRISLVFFDIIE